MERPVLQTGRRATMDAAALQSLDARIDAELNHLEAHLRAWFEAHRVPVREITCLDHPDKESVTTLWLVTDHTGIKDAGYRVVYDPTREWFGLETTLQDGRSWYIGASGSLRATIDSI